MSRIVNALCPPLSALAAQKGYCLPTLAGVWTLATVIALLLLAINYGNNLIFALAFLLLSLFLHAGWHNWRYLSGSSAKVYTPGTVFSGEKAMIEAELSFTRLRWREGLMLTLPRQCSMPVNLNIDQSSGRLALDWQAGGRGWQTLDHLAIETSAPLGLWRSRQRLDAVRVLVYPQPVGDTLSEQPLACSAHAAPEAESFTEVREYAAGDAQNRINWRIYARREQLVTNVFDGGAGHKARQIAWQDTHGTVEARLSQLTRWVLDANQEGTEYRLELPGTSLGPARGQEHCAACLDALALFDERSS